MDKSNAPLLYACAVMMFCAAGASAQGGAKKPVDSQTDLPRYSYPLSEPASVFVAADEPVFRRFTQQVLADVNATLDDYDIKDRATLRSELESKLTALILLGENDAALATLADLRANQEKPDLRLTTGLVEEALIRARQQSGASSGAAYQDAVAHLYAQEIDALDWSVVGDALRETESSMEIFTPGFVIATLKHDVDPVVQQAAAVSNDDAAAILQSRQYLELIQPVQARLTAQLKHYVAAHNVQKPDIWEAREVTLSAARKLTPVRVGIWDSGVDTALFPKQLYTDPHPGAHSPHGLAFDLQGRLVNGDLQPQDQEQKQVYPQLVALFQGIDDVQYQIESPDAAALRQLVSSTSPEQLSTTLKQVQFASQYSHGTHVAGIAARGNPAVRLVVVTFNDTLPEFSFAPTVAWVSQFAADFKQAGEYFRTHHVRVVNMSWTDTVSEFERWLSKTTPDADPATRKATAAHLYQLWRDGIEAAIRSAPDTLFVTAAGNSDSNAGFDGGVPASLREPNLIAVGAVNQAGDPTTFTSYGDTVVVYADGYRVPSFVPGGRVMRYSGTSMASPNVVNLAAKLWALDPGLTPARVIDLIKRGSDTSADGRLHVINPKQSVALLQSGR
jgi:subtilisin family serine protease